MITQTLTTSFKTELLQGIHDFSADTFKIALYTSDASLGADTTAYTTTGEVSTSNTPAVLVSSHTYILNSGYDGYTANYLSYVPGAGPEEPDVSVGNLVVGNFIPTGTTVTARGYNSVDEVWYLVLSNAVTTLDNTVETVSFYTPPTTANGYTQGGKILTVNPTPTSGSSGGTTAYVSFNNTTWANSSFTTVGGLIYNSSKSNKAVAVLNFGDNKTASGTFTITFPAANASNAIIRIA